VSGEATVWAWAQEITSPTARLVLLCLADHADEDGVCWPSQARIARKTGLSERAVRDALKVLDTDGLGLISRESRNRGAERTSDRIVLSLSEVTIFAGREKRPAPDAGRDDGKTKPIPTGRFRRATKFPTGKWLQSDRQELPVNHP